MFDIFIIGFVVISVAAFISTEDKPIATEKPLETVTEETIK